MNRCLLLGDKCMLVIRNRFFVLIGFLTLPVAALSQNPVETLKEINQRPFQTEGSMVGLGIIEPNSEISSYGKNFVVFDEVGESLLIISHSEDDVVVKIKGKDARHPANSFFSPRLFGSNPDYFRLAFDCTRKTREFFEVLINGDLRSKGYIRRSDSLFKFIKYENYVMGWGINGFDFNRNTNPLRRRPSENGEPILPNVLGYSIWRAEIIEKKDDWLKVKTVDNEVGWVRWRKDLKILIHLYFAC